MDLVAQVRRYIDEKGIKQIAVARKIGMSMPKFSAMMNGRRKMYADEFAAICIALEQKADVFINEAETATKSSDRTA